jgi:hypothetical protein
MKLPHTLRNSLRSLKSIVPTNRRGVALITVLTVMALTTLLVLTFFSLATSEHRASTTYSYGLQAQQVAEQAVNMVIAQIRDATNVGTTNAWASQPGAIRTWDSQGAKDYAFKLYSDDRMKTSDWADFQKDFAEISNWSSRPDHMVDLNEPVIRGEKVYYPIVHPLASTLPKWPKPFAGDDNGIEGFSYNEKGLKLSDQGEFGAEAAKVANAPLGHLAMPVRWIYQLADGTMGVLADAKSGDGFNFTRINGAGTPSAKNPVVARFAFWADDETTKLNLNTHAGGLAWDVPKAGGQLDMDMGQYQPAAHEWQRYPGHPATTHVSVALAPGVIDIVSDRDAMEYLFRVIPRVVGGGSESGTRQIDTRNPKEANGLIADHEPLFPSLDDMVMKADRTPHEFPDAEGNILPADQLSDYLERTKFFISVHSRAPETNLFNKPKVAIWPIYNAAYGSDKYNKTHLTAFDRLIHYCASIGKSGVGDYPRYEYIFRRENEDSATYDYDAILRNKELYAYLQKLLETPVPGWGSSFSSKYPDPQYRQILTEIFDYIRSTNLHDDSIYGEDFQKAYQVTNIPDAPTFTNPRNAKAQGSGLKGHGQVVPIRIDDTKGFGRFYTLGGVQVQVISCAEPTDRAYPKNQGATAYSAGQRRSPSQPANIAERTYLNFPPHPIEFEKPEGPAGATYLSREPFWLKDFRERAENGDDAARVLYDAAFDPRNWNWQLAYLDPSYTAAVLGRAPSGTNGPSIAKFNRRALSMTEFTAGSTRLKSTEQLVQGALYFSLFCPSVGWGSINPDMEIRIEPDSGGSTTPLSFDTPSHGGNLTFLGFMQNTNLNRSIFQTGNGEYIFATNLSDSTWHGRRYGGLMPITYLLRMSGNVWKDVRNTMYSGDYVARHAGAYPDGRYNLVAGGWDPRFGNNYSLNVQGGLGRLTPLDRGYDTLGSMSSVKKPDAYRYDLVTLPFKVLDYDYDNGTPGKVEFNGGKLNFSFHHGSDVADGSAPKPGSDPGVNGEPIQTIEVDVPDFDFGGKAGATNPRIVPEPGSSANYNEFHALDSDSFGLLERNSLGMDPGNPYGDFASGPSGSVNKISILEGSIKAKSQPVGRFGQMEIHSSPGLFSIGDVVQAVELRHGDARIAAGRYEVEAGELYEKHREYGKAPHAHSTTNAVGGRYAGALIENEYLIIPDLVKGKNLAYNGKYPLPFGVEKSTAVQLYGDFDNGSGLAIDGPFINKPDEGNIHSLKGKFVAEINDLWESQRNFGSFPYFSREDRQESGGPAYFSPNRIVSGPGMFGSLSTGVTNDEPWRTLLFRPNVAGNGYTSHPGAASGSVPDHLLMDLFWMPIVEPYAISEPLSTAGKVNMNYQIVPFLHVERNTALRGTFRSEMMVCIPNALHQDYKHFYGRGRGYHWRDAPFKGELQGKRLRSVIVEDKTLEQFATNFEDGANIYRSATEICDIHLIPQEVTERLGTAGGKGSVGSYQPTLDQMKSGQYWRDHSLVGDNSRERPYTNIQNRLTTKSNTFMVHYRAQVLKQARRDDDSEYGTWNPELDTVQAEYRGSSIVERYVDPNDDSIPDFATDDFATLDPYYRFRVVNPKRFAP